jgi:preprotein translocase subunit YajC
MKKYLVMAAQLPLVLLAASVFANEEPAAPSRDISQTLIMFGIIALFFYFIIWRPEQRRRKALDQQRSALKKGDRVVAMGIVGTIVKIEQQTVIIRMYDGAKLEFVKAAVTEVNPKEIPVEASTSEKEES